MTLVLAGFGSAYPEHALAQEDAAELHATFCGLDATRARTLRALYRRAGVRRRHSAVLDASEGPLSGRQSFFPPARDDDDRGPATAARMERYEALAPGLAVEATRAALHAADAGPDQVSHLITVSCTGFIAPGLDTRLVAALDMPAGTTRTHVGFMGCQGALNALRVASSFVDADPGALVVVCAVELCSLHFAYGWDPDALVANALFADGAAAVVARDASVAAPHEWRARASGTVMLPDSRDDMTWRVGNHGFRMTLSPRVPDLIEARIGAWLRSWLAQHDLAMEDVRSWAVHPGGPRILTAVEKAAGLDRSQTQVSREMLAEHGNMSSPTILMILERLRNAGASTPCVAIAFGPGLVAEAVLIV
jgi:predicted naringenin-chalcone synthase